MEKNTKIIRQTTKTTEVWNQELLKGIPESIVYTNQTSITVVKLQLCPRQNRENEDECRFADLLEHQ